MKLSKHLHSCLLVEDQGKTVLIDPGIFTYNEHALDIENLNRLDFILITHEHPDHFHAALVKNLVAKFPDAQIITNVSVAATLEKEGIKASVTDNELIQLENLPHESLWDRQPPANVVFTVFGRLTHPGDSVHLAKTSDVLALPITAPWGSTTEAVEMAVRLKPKVIIPIHDWMWKDEVRISMYQRLKEYFAALGIDFKPLETRDVVEI